MESKQVLHKFCSKNLVPTYVGIHIKLLVLSSNRPRPEACVLGAELVRWRSLSLGRQSSTAHS